eukprot:jgi/Botrbrau1/15534/Bobra.0333s0001.1
MEPAASSSGLMADLGPLRKIPHALFRHIFPGLPLPTILQLSRSSRDCRHAARAAIPEKLDQLVASVRSGCSYLTSEQLAVLVGFLERLTGAIHDLMEGFGAESPFVVAPDGTINGVRGPLVLGARMVRIPDSRGPCVYGQMHTTDCRNDEEMEISCVMASYNGESADLLIGFTYLWNNALGRIASRHIFVGVESCEAVEVGQAVLLLFQRAWQADKISFYARASIVKSPCQCAAIILASRSTKWVVDVSEALTWETGQEGPRLKLVGPSFSMIYRIWTFINVWGTNGAHGGILRKREHEQSNDDL